MSLFWKGKKRYDDREARGPHGQGSAKSAPRRRRPCIALEVKLPAMEAREAGLSSGEVAELVGVQKVTINKWRTIYLSLAKIRNSCKINKLTILRFLSKIAI